MSCENCSQNTIIKELCGFRYQGLSRLECYDYESSLKIPRALVMKTESKKSSFLPSTSIVQGETRLIANKREKEITHYLTSEIFNTGYGLNKNELHVDLGLLCSSPVATAQQQLSERVGVWERIQHRISEISCFDREQITSNEPREIKELLQRWSSQPIVVEDLEQLWHMSPSELVVAVKNNLLFPWVLCLLYDFRRASWIDLLLGHSEKEEEGEYHKRTICTKGVIRERYSKDIQLKRRRCSGYGDNNNLASVYLVSHPTWVTQPANDDGQSSQRELVIR
ncbi:hypothetical protein P5673_019648 [Acropora cervicornis]|uniref:Uncharacterized protein n=1 Tax=Acropora cervicornis TaxID=6130 RepID=A0AAD9V1T5_ACRCE|nr:hypothetical protein P5673_019648 [Acropora cervicornis]